MSHLNPSRRSVLMAGTAIPAAGAIASLIGSLPAAADGVSLDFGALRAAWTDVTTGRQEIEESDPRYTTVLERLHHGALTARDHLVPGQNRTDVFDDAPLDSNDGVLLTYRRLRDMATAWVTPNTPLFEDPVLLAEISAGLDTGNTYGYNPNIPEYGNWWTWEVGASTAMATTLIYVWDHLDPEMLTSYCEALDFYVPDPWYKLQGTKLALGAGRVNMCQVGVLRSLLDGDSELLEYARSGLAVSWDLVTSGDGFYADGSFITHDAVAYSGSYGIETITPLARIFALLEPAFGPGDEQQSYFDIIDRTFLPVIYRGQVLDSTRGRAVSRHALRSQTAAARVIEDLVTMSRAVDDTTAARWLGRAQSWVSDIGDDIDLPSITRVSALRTLEASSAPALPEPEGVHLFGSMDRVVIRRPGWGLGIAGASDRVAFYEPGNGENPRAFYTGAGMTTLYDADIDQFDDGFWPTVDWYRLPGTTSDQLRLPDETGGTFGRALNLGEWTGGSAVDREGEGAALVFGQHVHGLGDTRLRARKAWFCFGDLVVALGAEILSGSGATVETIVENRNLHASGSNTLLVDGETLIPALGTSRTVHSPQWAHVDGVGGYLFGPDTVLKMKREERSGSWADINLAGPEDVITRRFLTVWIWHAAHPSRATYEYVLLPGASPEQTATAAAERSYTVLANDELTQAVGFDDGVRGFAFWRANTVDGVTTDGPCTVLIKEKGRERLISVTPHGPDSGTVTVTLPAGPTGELAEAGGATVVIGEPTRARAATSRLVRITVPRTPTPTEHTVVLTARR